jgi:hypothetical protein
MKVARIVAVALLVLMGRASLADDIRTRDGKVYKNATITTVTPAYVSITYSEGVARVMLRDLPEELQKKYGYDSEKATQQLTAEAHAYDEAALQAKIDTSLADFDKLALYVDGQVSQVPEGGILFKGSAYRFQSSEWSQRSKSGEVFIHGNTEKALVGDTGLIFIAGSFPGVVDGDRWAGQIWPAGTYKYESVGAGTKTIYRWATTREAALSLLGR